MSTIPSASRIGTAPAAHGAPSSAPPTCGATLPGATPVATPSVAALESVIKRYGRTEALRGFDLTLRRGEVVAVLMLAAAWITFLRSEARA